MTESTLKKAPFNDTESEEEFDKRMLLTSKAVLNEIGSAEFNHPPTASSTYLAIEDANKLLDKKFSDIKSGWTRDRNGTLYIACCTKMPNCKGSMLSWWFRFCDDTVKYKWWHPIDHIEGKWSEGYYAVPLAERLDGHHVGHSHIVNEKINGKCSSLHIDFKPPSDYLDTSLFEDAGVTACLCARINVHDWMAGEVAVGHLCHLIFETEDGHCEMRSRFWLGDINKSESGFPPKWIVNNIVNSRYGRKIRMPDKLARGILLHCRQEMACLAKLLPDAYARYSHNS